VVAFDRAVTLEDKRILESCEADVPVADTYGEEMHMRTDYPGVIMRRMFPKLLAEHGETQQRADGRRDGNRDRPMADISFAPQAGRGDWHAGLWAGTA
jgi:hypothetical protein